MEPEVEVIADIGCAVGEGPLWHPDEQKLYWTDIPDGRLYRYDPATESHECFYDEGLVGGFTFQKDGSLLLFMTEGEIVIWRENEVESVIDHRPEEEGMRFNDVIADPAGRVYCGSMVDNDFSKGRLYRLDTDGSLTNVVDPVGLPNGMWFTPEYDGMYLTETGTNTIYLFDYDEESGELSNRRVFNQRSEDEGLYDGLTVDAEGQVWSALYGGSAVVRHTPDGEIHRRITVPTNYITSLTFAGEDYRDMYITTAAIEAEDSDAHAGALFRTQPQITGTGEFLSNVKP